MKFKNTSICPNLTFIFLITAACLTAYAQQPEQALKDFYKEYFFMGAAVTPAEIQGPEASLIVKHFNSLTAENAMKMGPIHPEENRYNWKPSDDIVEFAVANKMRIRGHTLCWHNQTPAWLFVDKNGKTVTKEILLQRLKEHINSVVTRYKGKIYAWDVVNEAIDDNDNKYLRESPWYTICGEEYIAKAFEYAHEADPDAILFYNDYNTESPGKRERIYKLIKSLLDKKVPVHGVGLQGHWSLYEPSEEALRESIEKFSSLGLAVQITELDISVFPTEHSRREPRADEPRDFTAEMEKKQIEQYRMVFNVLREYKKKITGVTFWNVSDKRSWLDSFPVRRRKNYPLLFDQKLKPKKAYWEVVTF